MSAELANGQNELTAEHIESAIEDLLPEALAQHARAHCEPTHHTKSAK